MSIDKKTVAKIAKLSRLALSEAEQEHYAREISGILKWVEQLGEVNTDNVPQLASVSEMTLPRREDKVTDGNKRDDILLNAPQSDYGCFVVPKVIE